MNITITGDPTFEQYKLLKYKSLEFLRGINNIVILSTDAKGASKAALSFAAEQQFRRKVYPVQWDNLYTKDALIKEGRFGKRYNARAGFDANVALVDASEMLIAFWDGTNAGTKHLIEYARDRRLIVHVVKY